MAQTALAQAFTVNGITPHEAAFKVAVAKYQNNGGTYERALAMLDAAYEKGSGGQPLRASNGHSTHADASRLNDGEVGQGPRADMARNEQPASPSPGRSEGQKASADKAGPASPSAASRIPVAAHDRHKPGHAKRGLEAITAINATMAKTAFASIRLDDGRMLGDIRWSEAVPLAQRMSRHARILIAAHNYAIPADPTTPLGAMVPSDEQTNIARMMERINEL